MTGLRGLRNWSSPERLPAPANRIASQGISPRRVGTKYELVSAGGWSPAQGLLVYKYKDLTEAHQASRRRACGARALPTRRCGPLPEPGEASGQAFHVITVPENDVASISL